MILPGNLFFQYFLELSDKIRHFSAICFSLKEYRLYNEICLRYKGIGFVFHGICSTFLNESKIIYHYLSLVSTNDNA